MLSLSSIITKIDHAIELFLYYVNIFLTLRQRYYRPFL